jgi:hypothetical protein
MTTKLELDIFDRHVEQGLLNGITSPAEISRTVLGDPEGQTKEDRDRDYQAKYQRVLRSVERIRARWGEGWTFEEQKSLDDQRHQRVEELYKIVRKCWAIVEAKDENGKPIIPDNISLGAMNAARKALQEISELQGLRAKIVKVEGGIGFDFSTVTDEQLDRELARIAQGR